MICPHSLVFILFPYSHCYLTTDFGVLKIQLPSLRLVRRLSSLPYYSALFHKIGTPTKQPLLLAHPASTTRRLPKVNFRTCDRVYECGEAHHKSSALRLTPQFEAGPPETPNLRYRVSRGLTFWWLSTEHSKTATRHRLRVPRRPCQDTLILPDTEPFRYLRSTSAPEHCQKRYSERSLVFLSDSTLWWQSKPPPAVLR